MRAIGGAYQGLGGLSPPNIYPPTEFVDVDFYEYVFCTHAVTQESTEPRSDEDDIIKC